MTVLWSTTELPGQHWDPEPDEDDDGSWCRTPGLLPEQRITTVELTGSYL